MLIAVPAFFAVFLRHNASETPQHLALQGDLTGALEILQAIATQNGKNADSVLQNVEIRKPSVIAGASPFSPLWRGVTCSICALWVCLACGSEFGNWVPVILQDVGASGSERYAWLLLLNTNELAAPCLVGIIGLAGVTSVAERRTRIMALCTLTFCILCAVTLFIFERFTILCIGISTTLSAYFVISVWVLLYSWTPLMYPTHMRGAGFGFAMTMSMMSSTISPLMASGALARLGPSGPVFQGAIAFLVMTSLVPLLQDGPAVLKG